MGFSNNASVQLALYLLNITHVTLYNLFYGSALTKHKL